MFTPEAFAGSPIEAAYVRVAPNPDDFPTLVAKVQQLTREFVGWPPEAVRAIAAPTLIIIGDSDIVRPEGAVELFRCSAVACQAISPASHRPVRCAPGYDAHDAVAALRSAAADN